MHLAGDIRMNTPKVHRSTSNLFEQYRGQVRWAAIVVSQQRAGGLLQVVTVQPHTRLPAPGTFAVSCKSTRSVEAVDQIRAR